MARLLNNELLDEILWLIPKMDSGDFRMTASEIADALRDHIDALTEQIRVLRSYPMFHFDQVTGKITNLDDLKRQIKDVDKLRRVVELVKTIRQLKSEEGDLYMKSVKEHNGELAAEPCTGRYLIVECGCSKTEEDLYHVRGEIRKAEQALDAALRECPGEERGRE